MIRLRALALMAAIAALLATLPISAPASAKAFQLHAETVYNYYDAQGNNIDVEVIATEAPDGASLYTEIHVHDPAWNELVSIWASQPIPASTFSLGTGGAHLRVAVPVTDSISGAALTLSVEMRWRCTDPSHEGVDNQAPYFECYGTAYGTVTDGTHDYSPPAPTWGFMFRRAPYA